MRKTIVINILIFAVMLIFINIMCHFILQFYYNKYQQKLADLPSKTHYHYLDIKKEFNQLETEYQPFIGWKRKPRKNQFNNVDTNGNRVTFQQNPNSKKVIRFFGGSTMWGALVDDSNSIPSLFGRCINDYSIINTGETGFNSRQSLAHFSNLIIKNASPNIAIFYDGVNDVEILCRKENSILGHAREIQMREELTTVNSSKSYFKGKDGILRLSKNFLSKIFLNNTLIVLGKINGRLFKKPLPNPYCCQSDFERANAVANNLLNTWKIAHQLAEANGIHFIAILQPNIYSGKYKKSYSNLEHRETLGENFKNVYQILKEETVNYSWVYDFSEIFNDEMRPLYFDFCHLNEQGNEIVANQICEIIKELEIL
ncbi:MAG: hypothetical protein P8Q41_01600 [Saprospiraceae bacterium]|nr:hypothetical protein [Saprospiraceae bacterium]